MIINDLKILLQGGSFFKVSMGSSDTVFCFSGCKPYKMYFPVKGKLQYMKGVADSDERKLVTKEAVFNDPRDILKF